MGLPPSFLSHFFFFLSLPSHLQPSTRQGTRGTGSSRTSPSSNLVQILRLTSELFCDLPGEAETLHSHSNLVEGEFSLTALGSCWGSQAEPAIKSS